MEIELKIKGELEAKFDFLAGKVIVKRERRIFAEAPLEKYRDVIEYAKKHLGFTFISSMTGLDEVTSFSVIYHMSQEGGIMLNIKTRTSHDNPSVKTVTDMFPGVDPYEREIVDLLGIKVEGLAEGRRYPLPDDWPEGQCPLRKDWKEDHDSLKDVGDMGEGDSHA